MDTRAAANQDVRLTPPPGTADQGARGQSHNAFPPGLQRLVVSMARQLSRIAPPERSFVLAELEQRLQAHDLCGGETQGDSAGAEHHAATPWQVRRAEQYIEAHWDQPITVDALVLVTHASRRSLYYAFRNSRGCSPMAFIKRLRLTRARQMLLGASPGTSVTTVALACGFGNLGHFARAYGEAFGERPSDTLRRTRKDGHSRRAGVPSTMANAYRHGPIASEPGDGTLSVATGPATAVGAGGSQDRGEDRRLMEPAAFVEHGGAIDPRGGLVPAPASVDEMVLFAPVGQNGPVEQDTRRDAAPKQNPAIGAELRHRLDPYGADAEDAAAIDPSRLDHRAPLGA